MDLKETAKNLIKIADQIEKDASDKSLFVCDKCNHTASLTEVNERRAKFAAQEDPEISVNSVTINDAVSCPVPDCQGVMKFIATDETDKYYVDEKEAGKEESDPAAELEKMLGESTEEETEEPSAEKKPEEAKTIPEEKPAEVSEMPEESKTEPEDVGVDDLFEDVETQAENGKEEKQEKVDTIQKARKERQEELMEEEPIPGEKEPLDMPTEKTEPEPAAVKPEPGAMPELEPKPKPKPKKKTTEEIIKKDVPKFKSKEAADRYEKSCARYSV